MHDVSLRVGLLSSVRVLEVGALVQRVDENVLSALQVPVHGQEVVVVLSVRSNVRDVRLALSLDSVSLSLRLVLLAQLRVLLADEVGETFRRRLLTRTNGVVDVRL